ncbi:MAG: tetratricopeptide repeat protein [Pseudomonadota bacterium]
MQHRFAFKLVATLALIGTLAACENSEDRAERYFQSGLSLLEEGDVERALIEFRNVFNLNSAHRDARQTYARVSREQGDTREAYGQYLRLIEQYPDDLEGRVALAEMSFAGQDWEEFERHTTAAVELSAEDEKVQTLSVLRDYRAAAIAEDEGARQAAFQRALELSKTQTDSALLQEIEIDGHVRNTAYSDALDAIERALAQRPETRTLYNTRLSLLARLEDNEALETQLRDMVTRFPEDDAIKQTLIRFYMSREEPDKAENFLREISDPNAEDTGLYMSLLQFIGQLRGPEAMMEELDRVIPEVDDPSVYQAMRAGMVFQQGDRDEGIANMEAILEGKESSEQTRRVKVSLAQMLLQTGNEVGARRLIEEVLAEDTTQVDALRMRAAWQIEGDDTASAIATLRTALDQSPQDVRSMTLMSQAYLRAGNRNLARDFLSLAVDASGQAPAESVRYARFLADEERYAPAEQILIASLRSARNDPAVLTELGRTYLLMNDLPRLRQVIDTLKGLGTSTADQVAAGLEASLIERENGTEAAIDFLQDASKDWDNTLTATTAVIRARLISGDLTGALATAAKALAEAPEDPDRRYMMAATQGATGNFIAAEASYRALVEEFPDRPRIWLELIRTLGAQGKTDQVPALLEAGLDANPGAPDLLWVRAGNLERAGDIEGAIAIYEEMYAENSNSVVISNNLASLMATHRDDAESLTRAAAVAARLRDTEVPAFQDTWGWIAFRQGRAEEALAPLESAAAGLPRDPLVQYHLGRTYEALSRADEAIAQFVKAVELAGPDSTLPQIADARQRISELRNAPETAPATE